MDAVAATDNAGVPQDTEALIDHILDRYHETHRRELPELIALARKVETVHGDRPEAPHGLADALAAMAPELEAHMQKEEAVLFPMMRMGGNPMIVHPIAMMRMEHEDHEANLARLTDLTGNFRTPDDACGSWRTLYRGVAKLVADLRAHIELENTVLFARFEGAS